MLNIMNICMYSYQNNELGFLSNIDLFSFISVLKIKIYITEVKEDEPRNLSRLLLF